MRLACTVLAAIGLQSVPCAAADTAALIQNYVEARGGALATHALQGVELSLDLVEPKFSLQAVYVANRNKCMRIDIYAGDKYLQSEGVSADGGWQMTAGKPPELQPEGGTATLLDGIYSPVRMIGLDEFPAFGHKVAAAGIETIGGQAYNKLTATYADGYSADIYLDTSTHLIARIREHKPMHLAIDPAKQSIETQFSDYRRVGSMMFPYLSREVNWQTGTEFGHTTVKSMILNSKLAQTACEAPKTHS